MDYQELLQIGKQAAKKSGEIQMEYFGKNHQLSYKSEKDFATEIDIMCEAEIAAILTKHFPDYGILGEENGHNGEENRYTWVVDPLDGTVNYAHGFPIFCTVISLYDSEINETVIGVVFDPVKEELIWATKDGGSFMNDDKIEVSDRKTIQECFATIGSFDINPDKDKRQNERYTKLHSSLHQFLRVRVLGSAGIDMVNVAKGASDAHIVYGTKPWDHLGPALIIQEAGGKAVDKDGNKLTLDSRGSIATNGHIQEAVEEIAIK